MAKTKIAKPAPSALFAAVSKTGATGGDWVCRLTVRRGPGERAVRDYIVSDAARKAMQALADVDPAFAGSDTIYRQCKAAQLAALRGAIEAGLLASIAKAKGWAPGDCRLQALPPTGVHLRRPRASRNFVRVSVDTVPVFAGTRESAHKPGEVVSTKVAAELGYLPD